MKRAKKKFAKLNHLMIVVRDAARSRDWYVKNIGLKIEFQVPAQGFVALEDDWGLALLISEGKPAKGAASGFVVHFEVEDVDARYRAMKGKQGGGVLASAEANGVGVWAGVEGSGWVCGEVVRSSQHFEMKVFRRILLIFLLVESLALPAFFLAVKHYQLESETEEQLISMWPRSDVPYEDKSAVVNMLVGYGELAAADMLTYTALAWSVVFIYWRFFKRAAKRTEPAPVPSDSLKAER